MNKNKPIAWVLAALLLYLVFSSSGERGLLHTKATDYELVARNRTSSAKPRRLVAAVGLSRTGTSSLTAALALLNYTTAHAEETVVWNHETRLAPPTRTVCESCLLPPTRG